MAGGKSRGNTGSGGKQTPRQAMESVCKANGLNLTGQGDGPASSSSAMSNETDQAYFQRQMKTMKPSNGSGSAPSTSESALASEGANLL